MREVEPANQAVVEAIRSHLRRFPDASDTPRGVQEWWLPAPLSGCPLPEITQTLWRMVADGQLVATRLVNGTFVFALNPSAHPFARE
ncbi:hypothetical protein Q4F19_17115 [Sphingomonas sp. BIUV-7]|uniref:Uncharacterized protein n=1 Tax=Sphingomonas natans TaxID=3063330 RepID=A0ABT8YCN6_9SPHN|nr:hypothetical protein [Sphingomonas sp. BIUV-7]MDO6416109.1 hypothetical protein [Sphingomonas sp. BIUV-7]